MSLRAIPAPLWFVAALVPMVVSQIVRLEQSDAATWIFWDYAGRLGALAVLGAIPSARTVAFRWERLRMSRWEAALWVVGIVLVDHYLCGWIRRTINTALPATVLGATLNRTAGCISSTRSSASRLLPTARRSCSAAVRVTCSRFT